MNNITEIADALEAEYLAVANGEKKAAKTALEPMVLAVQALREVLAAQEVTDAMIDAAIEALGPCVGSCGEASPPDRCDIKDAIEAALAARSEDKQ